MTMNAMKYMHGSNEESEMKFILFLIGLSVLNKISGKIFPRI